MTEFGAGVLPFLALIAALSLGYAATRWRRR